MSLSVPGQPPVRNKAPGPLTTMPRDGLDVGADEGGAVGSYLAPNRLGGTIESVVIEIENSEP
jgi:hypothetical protein